MSFVVQVGRSGTRVGAPGPLAAARDAFARSHLIALPAFIEPALLAQLADAIDRAPWEPRVHHRDNTWAMDEPAETPPAASTDPAWGADLHMRHPPINTVFGFLLNDTALFAAIESITGCAAIRSFIPNVYKIVPGTGHYDDWHTDNDGTRLVALSINVGRDAYEGGTLQVRQRESGEVVHAIRNARFGDAMLLRIAPDLEHSLTPVTGDRPRVAVAGWFTSAPCPFPGLPA